MMEHFNPDGSGFFQDDNIAIHRAHVLTEWLDEDEMMDLYQILFQLNTYGRFWTIIIKKNNKKKHF